jgi:hypothetical protein
VQNRGLRLECAGIKKKKKKKTVAAQRTQRDTGQREGRGEREGEREGGNATRGERDNAEQRAGVSLELTT